MTLLALRTKVCRYLQQPESEFIDGSQNLVIEALEAARLHAERTFSWKAQKAVIDLVVPPSGLNLATQNIKLIDGAWGIANNQPYPIAFRTIQAEYLRANKIARSYPTNPYARRYPSDADTLLSPFYKTKTNLVLNGQLLSLDPRPTTNTDIQLNYEKWMDTYIGVDDDYTDWMLERGHDYLFWKALLELNHLTKAWVLRQEGNLGPPERQAETALQTLHDLDARFATYATLTLP